MKQEKIKILITSVGSLVGQNIIEALEYQEFPRRDLVYLIGTNSVVTSANNFRCDKFHLVPETASNEFVPKMKQLIDKEEPDLILSARDVDTEVITRLMKNNPKLKGKLPYGNLKSVSYGLNKWQTWVFTQKYNLPFANTFVLNKSGGTKELKEFVEKFDFPLIAKPIEGYASKGVFFIRNWTQAEDFANRDGYMLQEYLGEVKDQLAMKKYFEQMDGPVPLFSEAPNIHAYSCQTIIEPNGKFNNFLITKNVHKNGATVAFHSVIIPELEKIAIDFAKAYIKEGGYGPFGIQFRKDKTDKWKSQEINLRTNGNTYARLLMGLDELGLLVNSLLPQFNFPIQNDTNFGNDKIIFKSISCFNNKVVLSSDLERIKEAGVWEK